MLRRATVLRSTDLSFLKALGISATAVNPACFDGESWQASGEVVPVISPITGKPLGDVKVQLAAPADAQRCIAKMAKHREQWMLTPAPKRGEIVRQIGDELRSVLVPLGRTLSLEVGKITSEGVGEVQEFIDICDFATGLSRQLPGQVIPSERPGHFMMEQWHPLGAIGIIAAFNFPVAVPGWNAAISMVCGNTQIWKCAPSTTLCGIATQKIMTQVLQRHGMAGVATFCSGGAATGEAIVDSRDLGLISFTGSTHVGRAVNVKVAGRFGKCLLELGGNNALAVLADGDLEMALRSIVFGAVGTAGQRCTTLRRLLLDAKIYDAFLPRVVETYKRLRIGDPTQEGVLVGPLHSQAGVDKFKAAVQAAIDQGGKVLVGGKAFGNDPSMPGPWYVQPTIIEATADMKIVSEETFAPIMYVLKLKGGIDEAIAINNSVAQGLSSALFTNNVRHAFKWASAVGSDCGIVNVNVPTNGAEIGGAFGGEKETGGGRESGSDSWKQYMRRASSTVNFSNELPLAQGINFNA